LIAPERVTEGMSVIVEFTLPAESFTLGVVLASGPDVSVELERIVPTGDLLVPFFWADADEADLDAFERAVRARPEVTSLTALDRLVGARLYEVAWAPHEESLVEGLHHADGTIFEGRSAGGRWRFVVRFPNHAAVTTFHNFLTENDIRVHLDRIVSLTASERGGYAFDLTPEQREVLVRAVEGGYFQVPRGTDLETLADELGITRQAASERLRRGADAVLRPVLLER